MSAAQTSYLVEILLPKETGHGKPIEQKWFEDLLTELTGKFGGATSFMRAPGQGLWRSGGETQRDNIAVIEVMAGQLEPEYWKRPARAARARAFSGGGRNTDSGNQAVVTWQNGRTDDFKNVCGGDNDSHSRARICQLECSHYPRRFCDLHRSFSRMDGRRLACKQDIAGHPERHPPPDQRARVRRWLPKAEKEVKS